MNHFYSEKKLEEHMELRSKNDCVKTVMKGGLVKFKSWRKKEKIPFVIYAEFEALNMPMKHEKGKVKTYQKHHPCGFCFQIICGFDETIKFPPILYRAKSQNEDVGQIFVETLETEIQKLWKKFDGRKKMILTEDDRRSFRKATSCWICGEDFLPKDKRVKDHCHYTGKNRGAAHDPCHLKYTKPNFIPVFFHNLAGYDSHLFVKNLGKTDGTIGAIANNKEKYISFSKTIQVGAYFDEKKGKQIPIFQQIRFVDSFKLMASSLEALARNLSPEHSNFFGKVEDYEPKRNISL